MLSEELSTDMDRITQLQDAILDLLTIASTSIEYITHRTQFEQTSAAIPTTLHTAQAAKRADYKAAIAAFVADITTRSKHIEQLVAALPEPSGAAAPRLAALQAEVESADAEYREAMGQAERVLAELQATLAATLDPASADGADGAGGDGVDHEGGPGAGESKRAPHNGEDEAMDM